MLHNILSFQHLLFLNTLLSTTELNSKQRANRLLRNVSVADATIACVNATIYVAVFNVADATVAIADTSVGGVDAAADADYNHVV